MAGKKPKKGEPSKTDAIRAALEATPNTSPKDLAEQLTSQGTKVSAVYVSTIKSSLKKRGQLPSGKAARSTARNNGRSDQIPVESLVEAKRSVEKAGGVDEARKALDVLSKLQ